MLNKVVYNISYGSFTISTEALRRMQELGFIGEFYESGNAIWLYDCPRHDPTLVQAVEELGKKTNGFSSDLCIAEVSGPYRIEEYDGAETVMEPDDYEWITP
jgi:hypothetical protein